MSSWNMNATLDTTWKKCSVVCADGDELKNSSVGSPSVSYCSISFRTFQGQAALRRWLDLLLVRNLRTAHCPIDKCVPCVDWCVSRFVLVRSKAWNNHLQHNYIYRAVLEVYTPIIELIWFIVASRAFAVVFRFWSFGLTSLVNGQNEQFYTCFICFFGI